MRNSSSTPPLSCKVFLGGVPWDINEPALLQAFKQFGNIRIEWPGKDNSPIPKGYLYVIFENEKQVCPDEDSAGFFLSVKVICCIFLLGQGFVECLYSRLRQRRKLVL